jgi:hypothetical protein
MASRSVLASRQACRFRQCHSGRVSNSRHFLSLPTGDVDTSRLLGPSRSCGRPPLSGGRYVRWHEYRVGCDMPAAALSQSSWSCQLTRGRWPGVTPALAVGRDPSLNVIVEADLALREVGHRCRKVRAAGDLVDTLPADPAQPHSDLVGTNDTKRLHHHARKHSHSTTSGATSAPGRPVVSHVDRRSPRRAMDSVAYLR